MEAKDSLKVKVFIWLLHHGVILTKDNLAKRNWQGTQQCCFCSSNETIAHLFFDCHVARLLWCIIHITFGLQRPNIVHMFGFWLNGMQWAQKKLVFAGLCALCWPIWLSRNDIVFHKSQKQTCLRILFRATYLARTWMLLQKEEDKDTISTACRAMESTAMEIFTKNGWLFSNRLCL